jgi:hypothetical protein
MKAYQFRPCSVCGAPVRDDGYHPPAASAREERIVYGFLGWCLGVLTFASALMLLR